MLQLMAHYLRLLLRRLIHIKSSLTQLLLQGYYIPVKAEAT